MSGPTHQPTWCFLSPNFCQSVHSEVCDTMFYYLHTQALPLIWDLRHTMLHHGTYTLLPGTDLILSVQSHSNHYTPTLDLTHPLSAKTGRKQMAGGQQLVKLVQTIKTPAYYLPSSHLMTSYVGGSSHCSSNGGEVLMALLSTNCHTLSSS